MNIFEKMWAVGFSKQFLLCLFIQFFYPIDARKTGDRFLEEYIFKMFWRIFGSETVGGFRRRRKKDRAVGGFRRRKRERERAVGDWEGGYLGLPTRMF